MSNKPFEYPEVESARKAAAEKRGLPETTSYNEIGNYDRQQEATKRNLPPDTTWSIICLYDACQRNSIQASSWEEYEQIQQANRAEELGLPREATRQAIANAFVIHRYEIPLDADEQTITDAASGKYPRRSTPIPTIREAAE